MMKIQAKESGLLLIITLTCASFAQAWISTLNTGKTFHVHRLKLQMSGGEGSGSSGTGPVDEVVTATKSFQIAKKGMPTSSPSSKSATAAPEKTVLEEAAEKVEREEAEKKAAEERERELNRAYYAAMPNLMTISKVSEDPWAGTKRRVQAREAAKRRPGAGLPDPKKIGSKKLATIQKEEEERFAKRKLGLLGDHIFISCLGGGFCWSVLGLQTAESYGVGAALGLAYLVLLSRFVEGLGKGGGGGGGPARLGLVFFLIVLAGKNRDTLQIIPAFVGFISYQLAVITSELESIISDE